MAQKLTQQQIQEQKLIQTLKLSQQQLIAVRLIEEPLDKLQLDVENELESNPALEKAHDDEVQLFDNADGDVPNNSSGDADDVEAELQNKEKEDRADELEQALEQMGKDDDSIERGYYDDDYKEFERGNQESFIDKLNEQMGELNLTDTEHKVMEYLIGSLESDGLLHTSIDSVVERLYIDFYIDVTHEEVENVLKKLQSFDPAGVGARDLRECLLLQIERMDESWAKENLRVIITDLYDSFSKNHWDVIKNELHLTDEMVEELKTTIKRRLTPKPGFSLGESMEVSLDRITPDFIVFVDEDGRIAWEVNNGNIPQLTIADTFTMMMESYKDTDDKTLSRQEREAKQYTTDYVQKGKWYIDAILQRRQTMELTMKAIVKMQRKYFLEGDEADLKPMKLEDIATQTGLDVSTISRVSRQKFIETPWGIIAMKDLFTSGYVNEEGEEMSVNKVKGVLKDIIDGENKKRPLSDDALVSEMKAHGYNIARRTIAKYRDQMKIPVARLRKQ